MLEFNAGKKHVLVNKFNPGGINAALKRWYLQPELHNKWVIFDGISVYLADSLENTTYRSISKVRELKGLFGDNPVVDLHQYLYSDY